MSEILVENMAAEEDSLKGKYLTFILDKETYGIPIKHVIEIIGMQNITDIPDLPDYVKGIINLRGKIIPVLDMRLKFKKTEKAYNDRTCIIVIELHEIAVGLIVDQVVEVIAISDDCIVPPPNMKTGFNNRYVSGIGKVGNEVKLLIDCNSLLESESLDGLASITD